MIHLGALWLWVPIFWLLDRRPAIERGMCTPVHQYQRVKTRQAQIDTKRPAFSTSLCLYLAEGAGRWFALCSSYTRDGCVNRAQPSLTTLPPSLSKRVCGAEAHSRNCSSSHSPDERKCAQTSPHGAVSDVVYNIHAGLMSNVSRPRRCIGCRHRG